MEERSATDIARETLKRLAMRRIPPTPDNYRSFYNEIVGTNASVESFPLKSLQALSASLPRTTQRQLQFCKRLNAAVSENDWDAIKSALIDLLGQSPDLSANWAGLIRDMLAELDAPHGQLSPCSKREALGKVLSAPDSSDSLFNRLRYLTRSWSQDGACADGSPLRARDSDTPTQAVVPSEAVDAANAVLQNLLAGILTNTPNAVRNNKPELVQEAEALATAVLEARSVAQIATLASSLMNFSDRLRFAADDDAELTAAALHLLHLITENMHELVIDDQWIQGQVAMLRELLKQSPTLRRMDEVEQRLIDLVLKQRSLRQHVADTQERMKALLASFVDRLADFASITGQYHDALDRCAERVSHAKDIDDLSDVLDEIAHETQSVRLTAQNSHTELTGMRSRVSESDLELARLHEQLAQVSEMVCHDALTGVLNRRGLDEILKKQLARARRRGSSTCIAMLDIDDFKRINDTYGHDIGDSALVHLTDGVQASLRPQDTLARFGGEEFVIVLSDIRLDDATNLMVRVQRDLTRRFFLHQNEKLLITFSCGVAEALDDDEIADTIKRADEAMYLAKRSGKNRVIAWTENSLQMCCASMGDSP